jgi:tetratricopeptide (TPR) repeat protein
LIAGPIPVLAAEPPRPRAEAPPVKRYKAFISYSWADKAWGAWAHKALETYTTPKALTGKPGLHGPVPARLAPIFKDREEEAAGAGITASIEAAMAHSDFMIVICSPHSARSKWVGHEVAWFKMRRDPSRVLALVVDGEPGASFIPGREAEECFPKALLYKIGPDLQPTDEKEDVPLAADARKAGDGKRVAKLKLAAAMLGLGLDDLVRREERRRTIRRRLVTAALAVFSVWMTGNTWFAISQRNEAREQRLIAEQQTENVNAALDYLVSLFEIANPATENPKTITALTILERGRAKLDAELGDKPMVRARLLSAIGSVHQNLGDVKGAEPILAEAARGPFVTLDREVKAKMDYADALIKLRKYDRARPLIDETAAKIELEADKTLPAALDHFRMQIAQQRANAAYWQTKYDIAIEQYQIAKALCLRSSDCTLVERASLSNNLNIAFSESGRPEEARKELIEVKEIYTQEYGPNHLRTAITDQNIAYADFQNGDHELALASMPRVVAAYERLLEESHPLRANANLLLGRLYHATGAKDEAIAALSRSRAVFEKAFGRDHNQVAIVSIYLALALAKAGRLDEALGDLARAQAIYEKDFPPGDPNFGDLTAHKGFVLAMAGRTEEAAAACRRGVAQMEKTLPPDDSWLKDIAAQCAPIIAAAR